MRYYYYYYWASGLVESHCGAVNQLGVSRTSLRLPSLVGFPPDFTMSKRAPSDCLFSFSKSVHEKRDQSDKGKQIRGTYHTQYITSVVRSLADINVFQFWKYESAGFQ